MSAKSNAKQNRSSWHETFNQIVLMLIVAFTFRVFVVEAFVIPTGSMAPTLKGAHSRFACENCGYRFDVNFPATSGPGEINVPPVAFYSRLHCPNCGFAIPEEQRSRSSVHYGDRILVLKYAYLLNPPQRWDVVVFKTPQQPDIYHYNQAYIKRLAGLPGEQIMLLDGDVYTAPASQGDRPDWQIQRKPEHVQQDLWRIVNDSSFTPRGLAPENDEPGRARDISDYVPWKSIQENGWRYSRDGDTGARAFSFADLSGRGDLRFDPTIGRHRNPLTDWLAYDQSPGQNQMDLRPVGDLKLSFFYTRGGGPGALEMKMSKRHDLFIARLEADSVSLYRAPLREPEKRVLLAKAPYRFTDRPARVEMINLDYQVRLLIDGKQLLATTPQQYSPDLQALLNAPYAPIPTINISAAEQVCTLTHLSLWRDIYYTDRTVNGDPVRRSTPQTPVKLAGDEFFVLGDNSPLSGDGRFWDEKVKLPAEGIDAQAGVVPARFMLGKAMLVYWPAGYRLIHLGNRSLDAIPNFGEMRFIH